MFRWYSAGLLLALACSGCLPDYADYAQAPLTTDGGSDGGGGGDGGCMPNPSGSFVAGTVYAWETHGYQSGILGHVQGFDCLTSIPSTNLPPRGIQIPIPKELLGDGKEHYVEFMGGNTPVLHTIYGPYVLDGTEGQDQCVPMHTILNVQGNIRDAINKDLSITLGQDPYRWIYGSFIDHLSQYRGSTVAITGPADAMANCKVNYTCEFVSGASGPCTVAGAPFINQGAGNAYESFFLITCNGPVSGDIQLTATDGHTPDGQTTVKFDPISVPLPPLASDVLFREWRPHQDGSGIGLPGGCG